MNNAETLVLDEESYLAMNGAGMSQIGDASLHMRTSRQSPDMWKRYVVRQAETDAAVVVRRAVLRSEFATKVDAGEIRIPTATEQLIARACGHEDNDSVQAARRICERKHIDWRNHV